MGLRMAITGENQDFKYVMQDVSRVYIGAKFTYQEMMDTDEIPFKLKAIFSHYILKEVAGDTTPENHIFLYEGYGPLLYGVQAVKGSF